MSLSVGLYRETNDGRFQYVEFNPDPPLSDQAGGERLRSIFYGSARAKGLGLKILPSLDVGNIHAKGDDLLKLLHEVEVLRADCVAQLNRAKAAKVELEPGAGLESRYLDNIREAIRIAMDSGGKLGVWIE